jgi:hypothetical protein
VRERWFGATGRRVPEIVLEGELDVEGALILDEWEDAAHAAFERGQPIAVRADGAAEVKAALAHPEVACVLVHDPALLELDLVKMTYGD